MDTNLEVFDVIRSAAQAGDGKALLQPFDGSLFIEYTKEKASLFGIVNKQRTLLLDMPWLHYNAGILASYELAWVSKDELTHKLFEVLALHPVDEQDKMRPIVLMWVVQKFGAEAVND